LRIKGKSNRNKKEKFMIPYGNAERRKREKRREKKSEIKKTQI
jgi:hypothetical protein